MNEPLEIRDLDGTGMSALRRLILTLADSKRMMGIRYSDWLLGAPSIEAGIAVSAMAQDEWGHARLLYAMLKDVGLDPLEVEHERPGEDYASVGALDEPFDHWAGLVAAMTVVDEAISVALLGFSRGKQRGLGFQRCWPRRSFTRASRRHGTDASRTPATRLEPFCMTPPNVCCHPCWRGSVQMMHLPGLW